MASFPLWVIVVDYLLGLVMWTLVGRAAMNLFLPIDFLFLPSCAPSCG